MADISQFTGNLLVDNKKVNVTLSCYTNSLSFLFCTSFNKVDCSEHLNYILAKGFESYLKLIPSAAEMLTVGRMEKLHLRCHETNYQIKSVFYKSFGGNRPGLDFCQSVEKLFDTIENAFHSSSNILLNIAHYSSAIKKLHDGQILFFDSHSNNGETGLKLFDNDGRAIVFKFHTEDTFKEYLFQRYSNEINSRSSGVDVDGIELCLAQNQSVDVEYLIKFDNCYVAPIKTGVHKLKELGILNPIIGSKSCNRESASAPKTDLPCFTSTRNRRNTKDKISSLVSIYAFFCLF